VINLCREDIIKFIREISGKEIRADIKNNPHRGYYVNDKVSIAMVASTFAKLKRFLQNDYSQEKFSPEVLVIDFSSLINKETTLEDVLEHEYK